MTKLKLFIKKIHSVGKKQILISVLATIALSACGGGGGSGDTSANIEDTSKQSSPESTRGNLISSKLLVTEKSSYTRSYAVKAYRIIYYTTDTKGNRIKASGLLGIPMKDVGEKSPLLSYQHGTIFLNSQAPSNSKTTTKAVVDVAGTGYIVSAADYLGYGEAANVMHPYIHADSLSRASLDMLRASKKFLKAEKILINEQLFLAGYSEGGYATLALQKAIQEKYSKEFKVTASAPGAGPFDLTNSSIYLANKLTNEKPAYMSFLLKAYDDIYALNKISDMYQAKYVDAINQVFDGKHSANDINAKLTTSTEDLFNAAFLDALRGTEKHIMKDKLALNNIYDWKPTAPTRFYHGIKDEIVPYSNSQKAFNTMKKNGAKDISFSQCPLDTHAQCALPYVLNTQSFFSNYATDL